MNKNAIQKYAIWARNELIEQVKQRAFQYGIDEKGYGDENAAVIAGRVLSADEKRQRRLFVDEIKKSGYNQAVEEVTGAIIQTLKQRFPDIFRTLKGGI